MEKNDSTKDITKKPISVLGLNPGTKHLALAVFRNWELREWVIKTFKGEWSETKKEKIVSAIERIILQYDVQVLAIKRSHPARMSKNLNSLVSEIQDLAKRENIQICEYSVKQLEQVICASGRRNKAKLAAEIIKLYPELFYEYEKEAENRNKYYVRLFEAVALGSVCRDELNM